VTEVVLPDGSIAEFPDDLPPEQIEAILRDQTGTTSQAQRPGVGEAFARGAVRSTLDNLLGIPQGFGQLLAGGAAGLETIGEVGSAALGGRLADISDTFERNLAEQRQLQPAAGLLGLPRVTAEDAAGLTDTALAGGRLAENIAAREAQTRQFEEQRPVASTLGGLLGDAATIASGRLPFGAIGGAAPAAAAEARAASLLGRAFQTTARATRRVAPRIGRTGAEVAALEAVKGGDPVQVGVAAATAQGVSEPALSALKGLRKVGLTKALTTAAVVGIIGQEVVPGGFQIVEETIKDRGLEIGLGTLLAGAIAVPGLRREEFAAISQNPVFRELANNTSRAALLKGIEAIRRDPTVAPVATQFAADPDFFGPQARERLERAFSGEESPDAVIAELFEDQDFRERLNAIGTPGASQAIRQRDIRAAISEDNADGQPLRATRAASALASRLPNSNPLKSRFDRQGPRAFIAEVLRDENAASALSRLGERQRRDVLEAGLQQLIRVSQNDEGLFNPRAFRQLFDRLPDTTRDAIPPSVRANIDGFLNEAEAAPLTVIPPDLARSLMREDGALARRLNPGR